MVAVPPEKSLDTSVYLAQTDVADVVRRRRREGGAGACPAKGTLRIVNQFYKAKHQYIPPGMSNANADVESIHSTIEREFFDIETFASIDDFWLKTQAYQLFYNMVRPNYSKAGKTPLQIILEERPNVDPKVLLFPVLDLDEEFCNLHGLEKKHLV